jgi:putative peptidoglycan lipid II flippase
VNSIGGAVFFRSVVVALLPRLSEAKDDEGSTRRILGDGILVMAMISIPLMVAVMILAQPLVAVAFQRGAFDASQAALLAGVIAIYALQFPFDAINRVYMAYWYARLVTVVPFANVVIMVVFDIAFAVALFAPIGIYGIALAYVLSSIAYLAHGAWSVHRRVPLPRRGLLSYVAKVSLASLGAGVAMWVTLHLLSDARDVVSRVTRVSVPAVVGIGVLIMGLALLRVRIWSVLLRKVGPSPRDSGLGEG